MPHRQQPYGQGQPGRYASSPPPAPGPTTPHPSAMPPRNHGTHGSGGPAPGRQGPGWQVHGGAPQPRRTNRAVTIAVVVAVVVVLTGFGITGFIAPGFLRSGPAHSEASDPDALVVSLVSALNAKDMAGMRALACADAGPNVESAIIEVGTTTSAQLAGNPSVSGQKVSATVAVTVASGTRQFEITGARSGREWCWSDIAAPGGSQAQGEGGAEQPDSRLGQGRKFAEQVIDKLNKGDAGAVESMLCKDSTSQADLRDLGAKDVRLEIDNGEIEDQAQFVGADLKGTLDGEAISAGRISLFLDEPGWCVYTVYAF
jgi:hypothetical protein